MNNVDPNGKMAFTLGVDIDASVAGVGFGAQGKVGFSVTRNPEGGGLKFQAGAVGSSNVSTAGTVFAKGSDSSLLDKAGALATGIFTNAGVSAVGEAGTFTGTASNPADLTDLAGSSLEAGGTIDKKFLTKNLPGALSKVADYAPGAVVSGQFVVGEGGIKGVEVGGGAAWTPHSHASGIAPSSDYTPDAKVAAKEWNTNK